MYGLGGGRTVVLHDEAAPTSRAVGRRLYVGNLAWGVAWQQLKDHFKSFDMKPLHADVALEQSTGRSRGYGFVEFASSREAEEAILRLNNSYLLGRQIFVREDREEST